jgi:tetratricopeptide (TPR) repeat protein
MRRILPKAPLLLVFLCAAAQGGSLGRIDFPNSGPPQAQAPFLRGVLLLHSFEYDDAREEFLAAQKVAPGFAMAYWGEAMTYNEPLWFFQDRDSARSALNRLAPTPEGRLAKAPTEREKDYLRTMHVLYGAGEKEARDFAYAEAMRVLAGKYPGDLEAASFYALALLGTGHRGRDFRIYMRAGAVVEEVFRKNPEHPGALHYLIHAYDDPVHAPLGLRAARIYARVAPEAAHALHMPSHIFVAMGMWDEVVKSNEDSWAASEARLKRKDLSLENRGYHALWWLLYGHLQQGRFRDARRTLEIAAADARKSQSRLIRYHYAQMRAAYLIETGQPYPAAPVETNDLDLPAAGADLFAGAFVALNTGDRAVAERSLAALRKLREAAPGGPAMGSAHSHAYPGDLQAVEIMEKQLAALLVAADGDTAKAVRLMTEAAAVEDKMSFEFGPPMPPKPAHELFGELWLQLGRPAEARRQFELSLLRAPGRALSLLGLARAFTLESNQPAARQTYQELRKMWHAADEDLRKALADSLARL